MDRINLDQASGLGMVPAARDAAQQVLSLGNPSSIHAAGRAGRQALEKARKQVAGLIEADADEVYFTSCGTEANSWALRGLLAANRRKGRHVIVTSIEHPSIAQTARRLQLEGAEVTVLPVDREARVAAESLVRALRPDTVLVSVMLANGEVGTVQPVQELVRIASEHGVLFHTDAVAAAGHWPVSVRALGVDALTLAADQFGGPPGAGALFVREGARILPLLEGGGQERGARSGTEALPAVAGMGAAAEWAAATLPERRPRMAALRDRLRDGMRRLGGVQFNGSAGERLPHNLHACVEGVPSESLVLGLDQAGVAVGLGSACNSKAMRPSPVLKAMGLTDAEAAGALVMTLGFELTEALVDDAVSRMAQVVERLRRVTAMTRRIGAGEPEGR